MLDIQRLSVMASTGRTRPLTISLRAGDRLLLLGGAGGGKTATSLALAGIRDRSAVEGSVLFNGTEVGQLPARERCKLVAWIPSNPALMFSCLADSLEYELALGLAFVGLSRAEAQRRIDWCVTSLNLHKLLGRDPFSLSGGEKVRAALALALAKQPEIVICDQVHDQLDAEGRSKLEDAASALRREGVILVETHARHPLHAKATDRCFDLQVRAMTTPEEPTATPKTYSAVRDAHERAIVMDVDELYFSYGNDKFALGPVSFQMRSGDAIGLLGPNGAGKTTLLMCLGQLLRSYAGAIKVRSKDGQYLSPPRESAVHEWARSVLYAFQEPDDQIYCKTVGDELSETAIRTGKVAGVQEATTLVAAQLGLSAYLHLSPFTLPRPLRRLVTIGSAIAASSPILLLDEPTAGLSEVEVLAVKNAMKAYLRSGGAIIFISHDQDLVRSIASRVLKMDSGKLTSEERREQIH